MTTKLHISEDFENLINELIDNKVENFEDELDDLEEEINQQIGQIVSSGSNANGTYIKFANGTMICQKNVSGSTTINEVWGGGYTSGASNNIDLGWFAASFIAKPTISVTFERAGLNAWLSSVAGTTESYAGAVGLLRFTSQNNVEYNFHVIAIGKWK